MRVKLVAVLGVGALFLALVPSVVLFRMSGGISRVGLPTASATQTAGFTNPGEAPTEPQVSGDIDNRSPSVRMLLNQQQQQRQPKFPAAAITADPVEEEPPSDEDSGGKAIEYDSVGGNEGDAEEAPDAVIEESSFADTIARIKAQARANLGGEGDISAAPATAPSSTGALQTHVSCHVFPDGFSLCYYENACFKHNSKEVGFFGPAPIVHDRIPGVRGWDDAGRKSMAFPSWLLERPPPVSSREASRSYADYADLEQVDFTYKDVTALDVAFRPLLVPLQHMREGVARPSPMWEAITKPGDAAASGVIVIDERAAASDGREDRRKSPAVGGGRRPAANTVNLAAARLRGGGGPPLKGRTVTRERLRQTMDTKGAVWVDNLYVVSATYAFKRHLWALGATTSFPLFSAIALNASAHLGLPPLDYLLVSTEMRPAVPAPDLPERFGWNGDLLRALLEVSSGHEGLTGWRAKADGVLRTSKAGWLVKTVPNPIVLSQQDDFPGYAPVPIDMSDEEGGGASEKGDAAAAAAVKPARLPPAVCASRAVLLGHKPSFVGGPAEANAFRYMLQSPLRLSYPFPSAAEVPGKKVRLLLLDREPADRPFTNPSELKGVLDGYKVDYTYMSGEEYATMTFGEQARLFNAHAIVVAAHGAALSNLVFSPPRSVVIEVFPRGVWKPTYARLASNLGHTHIPLFTFIAGGERHPHAPYVPQVDTKTCSSRSYPRITRDNCYPWLRALPVYLPKEVFEHALLAALNLATYERVEPRNKRRTRPMFQPAVYKKQPKPAR